MSQAKPAPAPSQQQFRTRKREAVVKYEPTHFRDGLLALIPDGTELEKYSSILEANAEKLEFKRYGEPLFEVLIVGGLLAPGGNVVEDGTRQNPLSMFAGTVAEVKPKTEVISKLVRRYKYLQRQLEDTLGHLLQYVNKFGDNTSKLSTAVGYFTSSGLVPITVLTKLIKDHLVKDGASLQFVTGVFKTYLTEQSIEHLSMNLRKSGMDGKVLEFFPPSKQQEEYLVRHFEAEGLTTLVGFFKRRQQGVLKEAVRDKLKEMFEEGKTAQEIVVYGKQQLTANSWTDQDLISLLWESLIAATDFGTRPDQVEAMLIKQLNTHSKVFAALCTTPKTELALLLKVQQVCYEDARFLKHYRNIAASLYKNDVVSESALLYWYEKGAAAQGKTTFLKQMEPFITWLKNAEDEDDEDEE